MIRPPTVDPARSGSAGLATRRTAFALLVGLALIWGFHWVVVKVGLRTMPPFTYATLRVAGGLVTLGILLAVRRELRWPARADLPVVFSVGLGQVAAAIVLMNLALQVIPAGRSSVLNYTTPLWVALILLIAFRARPRRGELIGLVAGLAGIGILLNPAVIDWSSAGQLAGSAGLVLAAVIWAGVTIHVRIHHWRGSPFSLTVWELLVAVVPLAVVALVLEHEQPVRWEPVTVLVLLYSGPLATAFAYWASQVIARTLGPMATAMGYLAVPVVGLLSAAIVLGEPVTPIDVLGFGLTLCGVAVTARSTGPAGAGVPRARNRLGAR